MKPEPAPLSALPDEPTAASAASAATGTPALPPARWQPQRDTGDLVRRAGLGIALTFLAIALAVAYYSANSILAIWFEYQWTPIVRLALALAVAGLALWVILRMTQRRG